MTGRAREVIAEAARNAVQTEVTRISVDGYADTSGTHQYNTAFRSAAPGRWRRNCCATG
nr:hypothetical protein [uncultured Rhodopila sp.]